MISCDRCGAVKMDYVIPDVFPSARRVGESDLWLTLCLRCIEIVDALDRAVMGESGWEVE